MLEGALNPLPLPLLPVGPFTKLSVGAIDGSPAPCTELSTIPKVAVELAAAVNSSGGGRWSVFLVSLALLLVKVEFVS